MTEITITYLIIVGAVALFVWNRLPVAVVALLTPMALFYTGILDVREVVAGFGDPVVLFVASLLVLGTALEAAGVTTWAGQGLVKRAGASPAKLLVMLMLLCAVLSSALGFMGTVAALLPVAVASATRAGLATSRVLMPMAFAGSAGGVLTLTASPVNMIVSSAAEGAYLDGFAFLEFALAGVPLVAGTIVLLMLLGPRLLPQRNGASLPADLSQHTHTLIGQYGLGDGLHCLRLRDDSPLAGSARSALALQAYEGIALVGVKTAETGAAPQRDTFQAGDTLMLRGDATSAAQLAQDLNLSPNAEGGDPAKQWMSMESGLAEVVIPPRSALIGRTVFPGIVTASGDLMLLAVQRGGIDLPARPAPLRAGDHLLLKGSWQALDQELATPHVLVVDAPDLIRRQSLGLGQTAPRAFGVMGLLVLLLATGWVPPAVAGVTCAILMVVLGVVTVPEAYRGMDWNTVVLLAGMIPLSTALQQTGAADQMAHQLLVLVGDAGPQALVAGLFVLTVILGQLISNTATALIVAPIAVAAAFELGISPRPVLMSIAVAAAASFLTPIATPPNLMIQGPGGYRFGDYWKLGLPLTLWFFVVAVFWVPVMWPFGTL